MPRTNWTRRELIVAFNLYCRIPFGKIHNRNPDIIALANALGRTPSALSWKLANFARFDPALKARRISGATHGGKLEKQIWDEFNDNWDELSYESEKLLPGVLRHDLEVAIKSKYPEGLSRVASVKVRVNQAFFRSAVLAEYNSACCITGLAIPVLLNASHIVPWNVDSKNRTNPRNGLCLNAVHDRAFDRGLITVTPDYKVRVGSELLNSQAKAAREFFVTYAGSKITLPSRFIPDPDFLDYHNKVVFRQ